MSIPEYPYLEVGFLCPEHAEAGPVGCCPWPTCPKGTSSDQIQVCLPSRGAAPRLQTLTRIQLSLGECGLCYYWADQGPLTRHLDRITWRELFRHGLARTEGTAAPLIYHYTSAAAALDILQSGTLHMTRYDFLNDTSEVTYGVETLQHGLAASRPAFDDCTGLLMACTEAVRVPRHLYVSSFSLAPDSLGQYRAYGPIAIGLDGDLRTLGTIPPLMSGPVIYDAGHQQKAVSIAVHLLVAVFSYDKQHHPSVVNAYSGLMARQLVDLAPFLKHPAFADEREWRFVCVDEAGSLSPKLRARGSLVVPYLDTRDMAGSSARPLPVRSLVVGPHKESGLLVRGLTEALRAYGFDDVPVHTSTAPLRT